MPSAQQGDTSPSEPLQAGEVPIQPPVDTVQDTASPEVTNPQTANETANPPAQLISQTDNPPSSRKGRLTAKIHSSKFPIIQKALLAGVIVSTIILAYSFFFSPSPPASIPQAETEKNQSIAEANIAQPKIARKETNLITTPVTKEANQNAQYAAEPPVHKEKTATAQHDTDASSKTEPLSLRIADNYFTEKDYLRAYNASEKLRQNLAGREFELVRDFLNLRMAICMTKKSDTDKANEMLRAVCESRSVALKALANYHLCLLEMNSGQYLKARTRAYKTIGLTGAIASEYKWALTLERECQFLAAEAIARQTLSLTDADRELPKQLWSTEEDKDPLSGLDEVELQKVLNAGIERFNSGLLAPQIQMIGSDPGSQALPRWSVVCSGPGIEELMSRFAANAGIDVKWAKRTDDNSTTGQQPAGWNRSVVLYLQLATTQQVITTAAGAVGLLALINDTNSVTITDPGEYYVLSEHTKMLNEYSIWLWRKLLLMYNDDRRTANAHFVLGILEEQKGQAGEAISEFKLVAGRYAKTSFAPFALLRSSRLKTGLRDYQGATRDLKQLIDQYPENELIGQAYLDLAETTLKAGSFEQACSLYRRAHNLAVTNQTKAVGALGAGKCFFQMKQYEASLKWLMMYLETVNAQPSSVQKSAKPESKNNPDIYTAYLLLGKTHLALGNIQQACEALERTVQKASASDEYAEAIASLVEAQMKQGDLVTALQTVENVRPWSFPQEQTTRLLLLKGAILRESGLVEQAITLLNDRIQYLTDSRLRAGVTLEIARCEAAANRLESSRGHFSDAIPALEAGPEAQSASLELAEVCLKLNDYKQTISICRQLLDSSPQEKIKHKTAKVLAAAYTGQKNYDKAALALLTSQDRSNSQENKTSETSEK